MGAGDTEGCERGDGEGEVWGGGGLGSVRWDVAIVAVHSMSLLVSDNTTQNRLYLL